MTSNAAQSSSSNPSYIPSTYYKNVSYEDISEVESSEPISFQTIHNGAVIKNDGKNWNEIQQPIKSDILSLIKKEIEDFDNTDVQVIIGEAIFNCHKILLDCYSGYFRNITTSESIINLPFEKIKPISFLNLYEWMLTTDNPIIERPGIIELFAAAHFLQMNDFMNQLCFCFANLKNLNEDCAFVLYFEAHQFNETKIQELMLPRIQKFFLTMVTTTEFLEISVEEVCSLLKSNTIGIRRESDAFYSAVIWLFNNWELRQRFVLEVMSCIRFNLMTPWELSEILNNNKSIEVEKIIKIAGVLEMIHKALQ